MLWIGAIFGALFGWVGILVAALFWATLAVFKLLWALALFAAQLIFAVSGLIARGIIWAFRRVTQPSTSPMPASSPRARAEGSRTGTRTRSAANTPNDLTPARTRRSKGAKR